MGQTFYFIDGFNADRASKKLMRRHVMKGKNTGKTLHRPSRLGLQVAQRPANTNQVTEATGNPLLTFSFPVEVTPYAVKIIDDFFSLSADRLYPVQLGLSLDEAKRKWFRFLFADESTYYCSIASMQAANETFLGKGDTSPAALHHLSQTLAQVKRRLESRDALSDSTIGIVVSLITQEQMRQHLSAAEVHVMGLKRIVDLRGGLDQLQGDIPLILKVCKADIVFALQHGGDTIFSRDCMSKVHDMLATKGLSLERTTSAYSAVNNRLDPRLHDVLLDIMGISNLFNRHLDKKPLDLFGFQEALQSICYRLLHFRSLNEARLNPDLQSAHHIGMTIFMMTIFLQYDQRRIIKYGLISLCVKDVLEHGLDEHEDELAFWLVMLRGIWVSCDTNDDWFILRLQNMAQELGIETWGDARRLLARFPWIDVIHNEPGQKLWSRVRCSYSAS